MKPLISVDSVIGDLPPEVILLCMKEFILEKNHTFALFVERLVSIIEKVEI